MREAARRADSHLPLRALRDVARPTVADQVFEELKRRILSLDLPPGMRISEAEVAARLDVSRQPVREAFKRLSRQGFLHIRPQSGTTISLISEESVLRARFIRTALEVQTCRAACESMSATGLAALKSLLDQQKAAIDDRDKERFHELDDDFHREICVQSGVAYVWELIHDSKAHMDRIRMLTLSSASQKTALQEHLRLYRAIAAQDADTAMSVMTEHLGRIRLQIDQIKASNHYWFADQ